MRRRDLRGSVNGQCCWTLKLPKLLPIHTNRLMDTKEEDAYLVSLNNLRSRYTRLSVPN